MKQILFSRLVASILIVSSALTSFAAHAEDIPSLAGKTIGISSAGNDHDWNIKAYQGAIQEIKRLGGKVIAVDAGWIDSKQISQIQTLINQKPDAIIVELGTAAALEPVFKKVVAAGIPLFTIDTATDHAVNTVTSDNQRIGQELALKLVADIGEEGDIIVFNGFYNVTSVATRYDQLRSVLKNYPKVRVIEPELKEVIPNTVLDAQTQITEILNKYPKGAIKAIWSAWDVPMIGAVQALSAAGRTEIKTYAVDGSPEAIALLKDPAQPATVIMVQQPSLIGQTVVDNIARYLAGQRDLPKTTFVPSLLATKDTVSQILIQLEQK